MTPATTRTEKARAPSKEDEAERKDAPSAAAEGSGKQRAPTHAEDVEMRDAVVKGEERETPKREGKGRAANASNAKAKAAAAVEDNNNENNRLSSYMFASTCLEPKNLRLLVCDSDLESSNATCNILQDCCYNVVAVKTSKQALEQLEKDNGRFDMILKEHDPPKSDACRMLRKIWKHKTHRNIPVVITSNRYEKETIQNCLQHGAADYLLKPLRHNEARTLWIRVWSRLVTLQGSAFASQSLANPDTALAFLNGHAAANQANDHQQNGGAANDQAKAGDEDTGSGMSTQSDADVDADSHEGSNPNSNTEKRRVNSDPDQGSGDGQGQPRSVDDIHGGTNDRVGPNTLHLLQDKLNKNARAGGTTTSNGLGKTLLTNSAFQVFNSPWNTNKRMEGNGYSNGNNVNNGNSGSNGKNGASNIIGPQHGNGSGGNGSNGNGSNGNGNGNGHESNGASSRRIMPRVPQANAKGKMGGHAQQHHPAPHQFFQQDSNMTLTPFGPMPSHLAQSVFWGMAAQQEMNYLTAMQYQIPNANAAFAAASAAAQQQQVGVFPQQPQDNQQLNGNGKHPNKKAKDLNAADVHTAYDDATTASGKTTSTQTGANGQKHAGSGKTNGSGGNGFQAEQTSAERRAAALDKYRQKRKTLCFSKKIRYASRKQLAEARPRNKGQFVRCNEKQTTESGSGSGSATVSGGSQGNEPPANNAKESVEVKE